MKQMKYLVIPINVLSMINMEKTGNMERSSRKPGNNINNSGETISNGVIREVRHFIQKAISLMMTSQIFFIRCLDMVLQIALELLADETDIRELTIRLN